MADRLDAGGREAAIALVQEVSGVEFVAAALVARIGEGDEAAEERLVQAFSARVRMMVRSRMRGSADEADLSQEILMAAITAMTR